MNQLLFIWNRSTSKIPCVYCTHLWQSYFSYFRQSQDSSTRLNCCCSENRTGSCYCYGKLCSPLYICNAKKKKIHKSLQHHSHKDTNKSMQCDNKRKATWSWTMELKPYLFKVHDSLSSLSETDRWTERCKVIPLGLAWKTGIKNCMSP